MRRRPVIGVMGPSRASAKTRALARSLGELIARRGWVLLTGGRGEGVMEAASEGAKLVPGSLTIGILPSADGISRYVDVAIITDLGNARNNVNVLTSDVVVACGLRGPGTVSEVALALKAQKPVILLGATAAESKFVTQLGGTLVSLAKTPEQAIALAARLLAR